MYGKLRLGRLFIACAIFLAVVLALPATILLFVYGLRIDQVAMLLASAFIFLSFGVSFIIAMDPGCILRIIPDGYYVGKIRRWLMSPSIPKTNPYRIPLYPARTTVLDMKHVIPMSSPDNRIHDMQLYPAATVFGMTYEIPKEE